MHWSADPSPALLSVPDSAKTSSHPPHLTIYWDREKKGESEGIKRKVWLRD